MLLAVLHRHAGIATWEQEVFVNAVGGVRIGEPAADLAVSLAVVSSFSDRAILSKVMASARSDSPARCARRRGQARLREGDRAEGQRTEGENRRARGAHGRAHRPGGAAGARAL